MSITHFANGSNAASGPPTPVYLWQGGASSIKYIDSPYPTANTSFGAAVGFARATADRIVVGIPEAEVGGNANQGSVVVYKYNGGLEIWEVEATLVSPIVAANTRFGISVDISDDGLTIVATSQATAIPAQENVFIYRLDPTWGLDQTITTSYSLGNYTRKARLSADGDVLILANGASQGHIEFWRFGGVSYANEYNVDDPSNFNLGLHTAVSRDGRVVALRRYTSGNTWIYYDSTGAGVWALREQVSGTGTTAAGVYQLNDLDETGEKFAFMNSLTEAFTMMKWDGANYQVVSAVVAGAGRTPETTSVDLEANIHASTPRDAPGAPFLCVENGGFGDTYIQTADIPPDVGPVQGRASASILSDDGTLCVVTNTTWGTFAEGRIIIYGV